MTTGHLVIDISGRLLAVRLDCVDEIVDRGTVTLLPQLPSAMPGVLDIRGQAIPLIDLGVAYGDAPRLDRPCVLVVNDGRRPMALLIDGVLRIEETDEASEEIPQLEVSSLLAEIA